MIPTRSQIALSAKACGLVVKGWIGDIAVVSKDDGKTFLWSPHTDISDCMRIEAALKIKKIWYKYDVLAMPGDFKEYSAAASFDRHGGDTRKARQWAVLLVAARVGKEMARIEKQLVDKCPCCGRPLKRKPK